MPPALLPLFLLSGGAIAAATPAGEPMERLPLVLAVEVKAWSTAESTVSVSSTDVRAPVASLHWHVTVDHQAGEPQHPIGWPRVNRNLPAGALRDWSDWDSPHAWVLVRTTRSTLPAVPAGLGLHTPDRAGACQRTLSELKAGEWVELTIPLTQIPRHHDVRQIQFHVAEQNYRHGSELDFSFSDLSLPRPAAPTLLAFGPASSVLYSDAREVLLRLQLAGVTRGETVPVTCRLERDGRAHAETVVALGRGVTAVALPLAAGRRPAGDYVVSARLASPAAPATARLRIVETPWN